MSNKGVAEVVGALLMVSLAVMAGIIVYVYSSGLIGPLQGARPQQPYSEQISLDYYAWNLGSTSGNLSLTIRNTGSKQITLADFFLASNPIVSSFGSGCALGVLNVNSAPPFCSVTLTYSGLSFSQGVSYNLRIVTESGAIFDFACIAGATR